MASDEQLDLAAIEHEEQEYVAEQIAREIEFKAEVQRVYWSVIETEGWHHVEGTYYANLYDAERQRIAFAERVARDLQRLTAYYARVREHENDLREIA